MVNLNECHCVSIDLSIVSVYKRGKPAHGSYYGAYLRDVPYSGKFSPGVKFRQFRSSVQVANIKSVNFFR